MGDGQNEGSGRIYLESDLFVPRKMSTLIVPVMSHFLEVLRRQWGPGIPRPSMNLEELPTLGAISGVKECHLHSRVNSHRP